MKIRSAMKQIKKTKRRKRTRRREREKKERIIIKRRTKITMSKLFFSFLSLSLE
jgi:hypothetical protein